MAIRKGFTVYDETTKTLSPLRGEAVDVAFHVGWFMHFAEKELSLRPIRHVTVFLTRRACGGI